MILERPVKLGPVGEKLAQAGIISSDLMNIKMYHKGTRDNPNTNVLKCTYSGVLFLDNADIPNNIYEFRKSRIENSFNRDNDRRALFLSLLIDNKVWADVGSGSGGLIERLYRNTRETVAVESSDKYRADMPVSAVESIEMLEDKYFDIITLFHTLEHIEDQKNFIGSIKKKLKRGGKLVIEVPHARDILIEMSSSFRAHTFWSEHLVLHTRQSLDKLLEKCGFENMRFDNIQRYGVANHASWLNKDGSIPDIMTKVFDDEDMDEIYRDKLVDLGLTDTIMVTANAK